MNMINIIHLLIIIYYYYYNNMVLVELQVLSINLSTLWYHSTMILELFNTIPIHYQYNTAQIPILW